LDPGNFSQYKSEYGLFMSILLWIFL
jgi:hypothetical protein